MASRPSFEDLKPFLVAENVFVFLPPVIPDSSTKLEYFLSYTANERVDQTAQFLLVDILATQAWEIHAWPGKNTILTDEDFQQLIEDFCSEHTASKTTRIRELEQDGEAVDEVSLIQIPDRIQDPQKPSTQGSSIKTTPMTPPNQGNKGRRISAPFRYYRPGK
ncbi:hypothetical protein L228DRAFT_285560 [Xylona heveae TC161]|uniref:Uncharacterized protein n=1 Tax=Xylona heveae (strain CBS 132557 / TC161) TaxID=1328760 RepID=A0A164ZW90_XYLHT|nr:hypothetical protein L228DRAFT_285560 [Xylona heveae TC161]KZF19613.1 hypothetical protein L228DRAFT_285560 [Xylona heveae TC161]